MGLIRRYQETRVYEVREIIISGAPSVGERDRSVSAWRTFSMVICTLPYLEPTQDESLTSGREMSHTVTGKCFHAVVA